MRPLPLSPSDFLSASTSQDAASFLLAQKGSGHFVITVNLELLARALTHEAFAQMLALAPFRVCDGVGARWILQRGDPQKKIHRIPGVDLGREILSLASERGIPVFLLGGKPGVAEAARDRLTDAYPHLSIAGCYHGYFAKWEEAALRGMISQSGAKVVFVCMGSPRQEEWIVQNRRALSNVRLFLPLGGSLDVYAGKVLRAPQLWQRAGLEWLWRISLAPDRGERMRRLLTAVAVLVRRGGSYS